MPPGKDAVGSPCSVERGATAGASGEGGCFGGCAEAAGAPRGANYDDGYAGSAEQREGAEEGADGVVAIGQRRTCRVSVRQWGEFLGEVVLPVAVVLAGIGFSLAALYVAIVRAMDV